MEVTAESNRALDAEAKGGSIGGLAAGAAIGVANAGGGTTASLGGVIGQSPNQSVGSVTVNATSNDSVKADVFAITAGVAAGGINYGETNLDPTVQASIDDDAIVTVTDGIEVSSTSNSTANSTVDGVSAGAVTLGVSIASASVRRHDSVVDRGRGDSLRNNGRPGRHRRGERDLVRRRHGEQRRHRRGERYQRDRDESVERRGESRR